jgi:hypothetical protein
VFLSFFKESISKHKIQRSLYQEEMSSEHDLVPDKNHVPFQDAIMAHVSMKIKASLSMIKGVHHSTIIELKPWVDVLYDQLEMIGVIKLMFVNQHFWKELMPLSKSWWKAFNAARVQTLHAAVRDSMFPLVIYIPPTQTLSPEEVD